MDSASISGASEAKTCVVVLGDARSASRKEAGGLMRRGQAGGSKKSRVVSSSTSTSSGDGGLGGGEIREHSAPLSGIAAAQRAWLWLWLWSGCGTGRQRAERGPSCVVCPQRPSTLALLPPRHSWALVRHPPSALRPTGSRRVGAWRPPAGSSAP